MHSDDLGEEKHPCNLAVCSSCKDMVSLKHFFKLSEVLVRIYSSHYSYLLTGHICEAKYYPRSTADLHLNALWSGIPKPGCESDLLPESQGGTEYGLKYMSEKSLEAPQAMWWWTRIGNLRLKGEPERFPSDSGDWNEAMTLRHSDGSEGRKYYKVCLVPHWRKMKQPPYYVGAETRYKSVLWNNVQ